MTAPPQAGSLHSVVGRMYIPQDVWFSPRLRVSGAHEGLGFSRGARRPARRNCRSRTKLSEGGPPLLHWIHYSSQPHNAVPMIDEVTPFCLTVKMWFYYVTSVTSQYRRTVRCHTIVLEGSVSFPRLADACTHAPFETLLLSVPFPESTPPSRSHRAKQDVLRL